MLGCQVVRSTCVARDHFSTSVSSPFRMNMSTVNGERATTALYLIVNVSVKYKANTHTQLEHQSTNMRRTSVHNNFALQQ